ncbi:SDR family oxidoreductase [Streptomyces sp. NPDC046915]|uniref:SDR family oxidoreductase n=1 Tax=Streptomyces sp. NPDC046915 TaxID=3155257 RepID=UPI003407A3EB
MVLALEVARHCAGAVRPGGTLLLPGGTGARRTRAALGVAPAVTAAMPAFTAGVALALAPVRVDLVAAEFVDMPLSAWLFADALDARHEELRATRPIGRVVVPEDVAALAVHIGQHRPYGCDV